MTKVFIILGIIVAIILVWYFLLREKQTNSTSNTLCRNCTSLSDPKNTNGVNAGTGKQ